MTIQRTHYLLLAAFTLIGLLLYSAIQPFDRTTWLLEVFPLLIALPLLGFSYRRFPLTHLLYVCLFFHALVLIAGGMYSYARVPLGFYLADLFNLARNPYDKLGHFFQGFVPALIAREIFIRGSYVQGKKMRSFLSLCVVMAISAIYELLEWGAALTLGQGADDFLGAQGDPWDTQSDMFFALIGGSCALLLFSRWHDRQLSRLPGTATATPRA